MIDFYRGKRVVVTGASGLIGSYAVKSLKESGAFVRAAYHNRGGNEFSELADEQVSVNLFNPSDAMTAVHNFDVVINCAGLTGGIGYEKNDPVSYVGPATSLAINVIHACYLEKVERTCFLSSTTVYPASDRPIAESDLNMGTDPYPLYHGIGWSKRFVEILCRYYYDKVGLKSGIVRPTGAYGRFDNFAENSSHVVPGMIHRALLAKDRFAIWGDGGDVRDLIHAEDVARGLLLATAIAPNDPFNLGTGVGTSTMDLAQLILKMVGSDAEIVTDPSRPVALRTRLVDIGKARRLLGFIPKISLEEGIRDTLEWYRSASKS
ncbi:MAG: NAD-dependent epimerase/dehydratase family protein [Thaumarchaeota archaeon]|nr:NAD-dependent epimerase/dehydratase family protein [Nitrososphaerota archaeon]